MADKFSLVVADPPFSFLDELKNTDVKRGASSNYDTMTIKDICDLKVKDITDPSGCVLALWVPSSLLEDGIKIMNAWGFDLKQNWIWVKVKNDPFKKIKRSIKKKEIIDFENINWDDFLSFGMGRLGRNVHEICLVGTRGKVYKNLKNKSQRTVFFYKNTKHSKKPEILQDRLDLMFPDQNLKRLEIFGRRSRNNWEVIGNQSPNTFGVDVRDSIENLLK
jgi:N6-adenosine-specific RNA methylase IME4